MLRQILAATLCAVLALPACSNAAPLSSSTPSHIYDAETLPETRVWGSNEKILLHFRAVLLLSEKQHWGSAKCSCKNVVGSVVTYDYDAYGNLIHSTGSITAILPSKSHVSDAMYNDRPRLIYFDQAAAPRREHRSHCRRTYARRSPAAGNRALKDRGARPWTAWYTFGSLSFDFISLRSMENLSGAAR